MRRRSFLRSAGAAGIGITFITPGINSSQSFNNTGSVTEVQRIVPVMGNYEVVVCGAGPAGVSAAIEAARKGAKTLLVEAHGCLGGIWTAGLLTWILDQAGKTGFMREIEAQLIARGGANREIDTGKVLSFNPEVMKFMLEELCVEAGVDILYHTRVVSSVQDDNKRLTHIITESKSGREAWAGKIFLHTTGDGDLAAVSGCSVVLGRDVDGS
ncbi:MAG: FAD-dependent oxidoreductase, partial [Prolixibacteraceae bacterium]|nr:FAD-dependent oxidoreductase [Prolixibacteraceae bacterium]